MTIKQITERLGVKANEIDLILDNPCKSCKKFGGKESPECAQCQISLHIEIKK